MRRAVILFDNDCGLCRWSLSKLLAWDRRRCPAVKRTDRLEGSFRLAASA